jgi:hypothetical protein
VVNTIIPAEPFAIPVQVPRRARLAITGLLILVLIMGGANLLATYFYVKDSQASAKRQGFVVEQKICSTLNALAKLTPPPGNPKTNPSRAYDQQLHATLDGLGPDLGCGKS